jgi:hypothetical protein
MRSVANIWKALRSGNNIDDIELSALLKIVENIISDTSQLQEGQYDLFISDLRGELYRLTSYASERKE